MIDEMMEFPPENDPMAIKVAQENKNAELNSLKKKAIESITVTIHNVKYAGDDVSQNRMGNTLAIANWKFNQAIGITLANQANSLPDDHPAKSLFSGLANVFNGVYHAVYKDTKLDWKNADGKISHVEAESIGEALFAAMTKVGEEIKKATK